MGEYQVLVGEGNAEHGTGEHTGDRAFHRNRFLRIHDQLVADSAAMRTGPRCAIIVDLPAISGKRTIGSIWPGTFFPRTRFVYGKRAPVELLTVYRIHGRGGMLVVVHGHEREPSRPTGHSIHHQLHFADLAMLFEKILKIVLGGFE
jgi:hypothetical protein